MQRRTLWLAFAVGLLALGLATPGPRPAGAQSDRAPGRRVAVTIDDLPVNEFRGDLDSWRDITALLVGGLVRHEAPAIGFVNENKLYLDGALDPRRVELLRTWLDAGLQLGNHSFSHPDLHRLPLARFQADVLRGEDVLRELLAERGAAPRFFRHPFLHTGRDLQTRDALQEFLSEHVYRVAPVTIDNQEWIYARAYDHEHARGDRDARDRISVAYIAYMNRVFAYYEQQSEALFGRQIAQTLLIHANRLAADTLDELVQMIRGRGYTFLSLEQALRDPAYDSPDTYTGAAGITWLHRWALTAGKHGGFFATEPEADSFVRESFNNPPAGR